MRITIVSGFFLPVPPCAGGAMEKIWWRLAREFAGRGHEVTLFSRCWPGWPRAEVRDGVRLQRRRGFDHRRSRSVNLILDAVWGARLTRALPSADILVTNTIGLPIWVRALRRDAGQLVVNLNRHPKGQLRAYRDVARLQAASAAIGRAALDQAPRLRSVLRITPNPIDAHLLAAAAAARQRPPSPLRIGYHGRLHPEKGLLLLLEAARLLLARADTPPWTLVLRGPIDVVRGGGGPSFLQELEQAAAPLRADNRFERLEPEFDDARLAAAYADLDVFCYPTAAESGEALPVAVLEAMAAARPVIVTDLPCFHGLIQTGVTGWVLKNWKHSDAPARLADQLAELLLLPEKRANLGATAARAVAPLDFSVVADAMLSDFSSLLDAAR